jgi:hypothetical protein
MRPIDDRSRLLGFALLAVSLAACGEGLLAGGEADEPEGYLLNDPDGDRSSYAACPNGGKVSPATPGFGSTGVESYASYDGQDSCSSTSQPGVVAFRDLVLATYPCTTSGGITRGCGVGGKSEHKEGRAWDWMIKAPHPAADALLGWLLASDGQGNAHAIARRLGVMYIIWNKKIWKSYQASKGWQGYSGSSPHTDHVHFSFSWAGAKKTTSFWSGAPGGDPEPTDPVAPPGQPEPSTPSSSSELGPSAPDAGSAPAPAIPPDADGFTGDPCASDGSCSTGQCLLEAAGWPGGSCTESCTQLCPDQPGKPTTFCVELSGGGLCVSRCDTGTFPGTGCRSGYHCVKMPRFNQASVERNVCLPEAGVQSHPAGARPADLDGDRPNPEVLGGCSTGGGGTDGSGELVLLGLAALGLGARRRDRRRPSRRRRGESAPMR